RSLGNAMNISVTAEGVETEEQLAMLQQIGVDELQGFYFAKPMSEADVHAALSDRPSITAPKAEPRTIADAVPA
ncbi:MAG: EAL domain-containing protein, partial [Hyphomicrobiales bacterium]|nr:EAL domain-containing protein [Hyphomicrobiales bacterium]